MQKNILITGEPRSGKSTLLEKVISDIPKKVGFITKEILINGERTGFEILTHFGTTAVFADVNRPMPHKFSKYFVNVGALDAVISKVEKFSDGDVLYIDEIAPMELFSDKFKQLVLRYMNAKNVCLATIKQDYEDDFIQSIKKRDDIMLIQITQENREEKEAYIRGLVEELV